MITTKLREHAEEWLTRHRWLGMSAQDADEWWSADTHTELGEVTARWLEGTVRSQIGYQPRCGPDPETAGLISTLAFVNRLGYVTDGSQPGEREEIPVAEHSCSQHGMDGEGFVYEQRAAVEGWTTEAMADDLRQLAAEHGFHFIAQQPRRTWGRNYGPALPVSRTTYPETEIVMVQTCFGTQRSRHELEDVAFNGCNPTMIERLIAGWNVTIVDDEWGPSDRLWKALETL